MPYTTTFTCDRCRSQAIDDSKFLTEVSITMPDPYATGYSNRKEVAKAYWCAPCTLALGLRYPTKGEVAPEEKPSFEDIIREIVREEIGRGNR